MRRRVRSPGMFGGRVLLRKPPERLGSKRILVYEFASRDLYLEDWPPAPLPVRRHSAAPVVSSPADVTTTQRNVAPTNSMGPLIVHGRITAVSRMPEPGGSPYKDC